MRKQLLIVTGIVLAVAVIVPAALELHAYHRKLARSGLINQEHGERIKQGMSRAQVEAILGGPPGDFTTDESVLYFYRPFSLVVHRGRWGYWSGNEGQIAVTFDEQDVVTWQQFAPAAGLPTPSLSERIRAWLRRLWP